MKRLLPPILLVALALAAVTAGSGAVAHPTQKHRAAGSTGGFRTAIYPAIYGPKAPRDSDLQFERIREAGATAVRLDANWSNVAPIRPHDPTNPADPAYRWYLDSAVRLAQKHGLTPILLVYDAPDWAQAKRPRTSASANGTGHAPPGPYKPSPTALGQFAKALARHYSGSFRGLPRVRDFIAWDEPNNYPYLTPQRVHRKAFSPGWYRRMVNSFARGVHSVHSDNKVIAGALLFNGVGDRISPLAFMRNLLCMSKAIKARTIKRHGRVTKIKARPTRPTCKHRTTFDIWTHHPYTRGNPFHHAGGDDVSLADLPAMNALLRAAVKAHHVVSRHKVQFWVDEFSYESSPPDNPRRTVPVQLEGRWVAESLYQMWRSGVSLGTWFLLRDAGIAKPVKYAPGQSGLYANQTLSNDPKQDHPKPALAAFEFPFVAYRGAPPEATGKAAKTSKSIVTVWGRTHNSKPAAVNIQVGTRYGWHTVTRVHARSGGVFTGKLKYAAIQKRMKSPKLKVGYPQAVIADRPRSYWRLNDTGGRTAKDQMNRAKGVYEGPVRRGQKGPFKGSRAVGFQQGARVSLPSMLPPQAIELWVKTKARSLPTVSFRDDASPAQPYVGQVRGYADATQGSSSVMSYNFVNDGKWHYVVFTRAPGDTAQLWVDGRFQDQEPWPDASGESAANLAYDPLLQQYLNGSLSEVAIYDHQLTETMIARHYTAAGRTFPTFGLLRARVGSGTAASLSLPFSLQRPRNRYVLAFG